MIGRFFLMALLAFDSLIAASCDVPKGPQPKQGVEVPKGPIPGRHKITITRMALSDSDFTLSLGGNPRDIELYVSKDGERRLVMRIAGFRGPKDMNVSFELDYEPNSRYEFTIEETVIVGQGKKWNFAGTQPGNWRFEKGGPFGAGSSISFKDEKVQ